MNQPTSGPASGQSPPDGAAAAPPSARGGGNYGGTASRMLTVGVSGGGTTAAARASSSGAASTSSAFDGRYRGTPPSGQTSTGGTSAVDGGGSIGVVPSWAWLPGANEVFAIGDPVQCRPLGSPPVVDDTIREPGVTEVLHVMDQEYDTQAWSVRDITGNRRDAPAVKDSTTGERVKHPHHTVAFHTITRASTPMPPLTTN